MLNLLWWMILLCAWVLGTRTSSFLNSQHKPSLFITIAFVFASLLGIFHLLVTLPHARGFEFLVAIPALCICTLLLSCYKKLIRAPATTSPSSMVKDICYMFMVLLQILLCFEIICQTIDAPLLYPPSNRPTILPAYSSSPYPLPYEQHEPIPMFISCTEAVGGDNLTVLLDAGIPFSSSVFGEVMPMLSTSFPSIKFCVFDRRGYGLSGDAEGIPRSTVAMVKELKALMQEQKNNNYGMVIWRNERTNICSSLS
eukprot:TRINITY_DN5098_c0_g1_i2.p1 TRINITY_DN5098_c0_g1~~TRINITY_DN5098_c0_g1_i2.p1  ORF type:complete len:255 (-),score=37.19 TRINITY_DN5098_c0_g1_i2:390-1154(-)